MDPIRTWLKKDERKAEQVSSTKAENYYKKHACHVSSRWKTYVNIGKPSTDINLHMYMYIRLTKYSIDVLVPDAGEVAPSVHTTAVVIKLETRMVQYILGHSHICGDASLAERSCIIKK